MKDLLVLIVFILKILHQVIGHCQLQCILPGSSCSTLFKNQLPIEKIKSYSLCRFDSSRNGSHTSYCCQTSDDLEDYLYKNNITDIVRSLAGVEPHEYPHHVQINGRGSCGGTIYNKFWIITAAHCIKYKGVALSKPGEAYVIAGQSYLGNVTKTDKYDIAEIIPHEKWDDQDISKGFDLALVRLSRPLFLEKGKIQPLRIDSKDAPPQYGSKGVIVGFGNVDERLGPGIEFLMESTIAIHTPAKAARLSLDRLHAADNVPFVPLPQQMAAGGEESGVSVGQGDSGGPLICADKHNKPVLCGVASFKKCKVFKMCRRPSYFTKVALFVDWIKEKTNNASQEEDLIFDEPMFPTKLPDHEIPDYLLRIAGKTQSCSGVLVSPKIVLTTAECIFANGEPATINSFALLYHYRSGKHIYSKGIYTEGNFQRNISERIFRFLGAPLGLNDLATIVLREPVEASYLQLPPEGFVIKDPLIEYTTNEITSSVEARHYLPIDSEECERRIQVVDSSLQLQEQYLCMSQVYSAEANCNRDLGGPLVCGGKYLCGLKVFQGCKFSAFPEIFNNFMGGYMREVFKDRWNII